MKKLVEKHKDIKLLLAGDGNKREFLEKKIKEYDLTDNIKLLGYRTDIPKLLKISDLSLSTSKREGLPVNVIEALHMGLPVIGTDCRGTRDLIQNEQTGYRIKIDDTKSLCNSIEKVKNGFLTFLLLRFILFPRLSQTQSIYFTRSILIFFFLKHIMYSQSH